MSARAALYARVSTAGQCVDSQLARLREAAPGAIAYADCAVSGRQDHHVEFDKLRAAVERGELATVYVTKLDRLGRSTKTILEFFDLAERSGVRVVVPDQGPIDTSTSVGRLVPTVLAAMAELEGDLIAERTREAMAAFKNGSRMTRSGKPVGRPRRHTPGVAQRIREERGNGLKWAVVAQHAGILAGTCGKVGMPPQSDTPRVENPDPGFGAQSGGS